MVVNYSANDRLLFTLRRDRSFFLLRKLLKSFKDSSGNISSTDEAIEMGIGSFERALEMGLEKSKKCPNVVKKFLQKLTCIYSTNFVQPKTMCKMDSSN